MRRARVEQRREPVATGRRPHDGGSTSSASIPSRAAMKRFSLSTSGGVGRVGSGRVALGLEPDQALDERRDRGRVRDTRLGVHDPHLERAEARL